MANGSFGGGSGTSTDPYLVEDAADLDAIRNNLTAYYKQISDIDLTGYTWVHIGSSYSDSFSGGYDGNYYFIRNLTIDRTDYGDFTGLFGWVTAEYLKNTKIESVNATTNGKYIGSLAGIAYKCDVINCSVENGTVTGTTYVGGLLGDQEYNSVLNCLANVNVVGNESVAGLLGRAYRDSGTDVIVKDCYASGDINASTSTDIGFVIGAYVNYVGTFENLYFNGTYSGSTPRGIAGGTDQVTSSYYDSTVLGSTSFTSGTAKTTTEMKQQATYSGWDFSNIWYIDEGNDYPKLRWSLDLDTTPPANVTNLSETHDTNSVSLTWTNPTDSDFSTCYIYRDSAKVGESSSGLFTDSSGLTEDTIYNYLVTSVDSSGNESTGTSITATTDKATIEIYTATDLDNIRNDLTANYVLMNDIDLSSWGNWTPIWSYTVETLSSGVRNRNIDGFEGTFDGQGYTISNMSISLEETESTDTGGDKLGGGLFYSVNGSIKNLTIKDSSITSTDAWALGLLCGEAFYKTVIDNVNIANCSVDSTTNTNDWYTAIGLLIGEAILGSGDTTNCTISGSITHNGPTSGFAGGYEIGIGGLIGVSSPNYNTYGVDITNCNIDVVISSNSSNNDLPVGGVVGEIGKPTTFTNVSSKVDITSYSSNIGGFIGYSYEGDAQNCSSEGKIKCANSLSNVGGFIGYLQMSSMNENYSSVDIDLVDGVTLSSVGGFVGFHSGGSINNCYARGSTTITSVNTFVGALDSYSYLTLNKCYTTFSSPSQPYGATPYDPNYVTITDCYTNIETTEQHFRLVTDSQLKQQSTFTNWDFTNVWGIVEDRDYPYLLWQPYQPPLKRITTKVLLIKNLRYKTIN